MKMKLSSFKKFKTAGIVICMLAAGICYSCGGCGALGSQEEAVMELGLDKTRQADSSDPELESEAFKNTAGSSSKKSGDAGETAESKVQPVFVHVCGQVKRPGVYELPAGSRVYEAIEAAGGFTGEAAGDYLNLAQTVQDGMKLEAPDREQAEIWKSQVQSSGENSPGGGIVKVNINTASKEELMNLKGIGESRADDIIRYRDRFGGFQTIEDIMNVSGIKEAAFEKIKDNITV